MRIATIVGARPQFIKAAPVSRVLRREHTELLIHTGQHYDEEMSDIFFRELEIPRPHYNLGVGSSTHGQQTGEMLARIESVLIDEKPDWVLVYGDTNSTLAGALAAVKLQIPVGHVEAGLRSFNRTMPEEHNRVLTDHCSNLLLCPTKTAAANLEAEGINDGVHVIGDVMFDAVLQFAARAEARATVLRDLDLQENGYILATIHRPYNTDNPQHLAEILNALNRMGAPVVLPVHPRTRKSIERYGLTDLMDGHMLRTIEPVGYLDMLQLEQNAQFIVTDSGGVQKEAFFFAVPCLTVRPETEWVETVETGWNRLVDPQSEQIVAAGTSLRRPEGTPPPFFGTGNAAEEVGHLLREGLRG